jgi:hypothetical protein
VPAGAGDALGGSIIHCRPGLTMQWVKKQRPHHDCGNGLRNVVKDFVS